MNKNKTEILVINQNQTKISKFREFKMQSHKIKYLGCYISANKKQLFKDNFSELKKDFKNSLNNYKDLKLNLMGRINLIKMMWLPKFIYLFQCMPLIPPKSFFAEINSIILSFIWNGKTPRIKKDLLFCPKQEGGLNLPNMELYHMAAHTFYIDRIINNTNEDPWLDIENHQLQPSSLLTILFSKKKVKSDNFVINSTCKIWNRIKEHLGVEVGTPRHIKVWNNPSITIQGNPLVWKSWMHGGIEVLSDIVCSKTIVPFDYLKIKFKLQDSEIFKYMQMKNWLKENCNFELDFPEKIDFFENKEKKNRIISKLYITLIKTNDSSLLLKKIYEGWNRDLTEFDSKTKWKECLRITYAATTNENLRMIQYKLMTRTYYSRDKIHKFDSSSSPACLKCGKIDSLVHSFWYCQNVRKTWFNIESLLSNICKEKFIFTPETCLLQSVGKLKYPRGWQTVYSSLVFKKLLLKNWKNKETPGIEQWRSSMKYYLHIEKGISDDKNKNKQFDFVWKRIFEAL